MLNPDDRDMLSALSEEGAEFLLIDRPHPIRNKRATGRPKDITDLDWLDRAST